MNTQQIRRVDLTLSGYIATNIETLNDEDLRILAAAEKVLFRHFQESVE